MRLALILALSPAVPAAGASGAAPMSVHVSGTHLVDGCDHDYTDTVTRFGDAHGFSYLAWTCDTWGCTNGLISSYDGTPTPFGMGVRDHLRLVVRP